jgi:hypothetical protein
MLLKVEQPEWTQRGRYLIMIPTNETKSEKKVSRFGTGAIALLFALVMLALAPLYASAQQSPTIAGDYAGTMGPLHIILHLRVGDRGKVTATLDNPDQGAIGIHCSNFQIDGQSVAFSVPAVHGTWKGTVDLSGALNGTWDQGSSVPLNFARETVVPAEKASKTSVSDKISLVPRGTQPSA